MKQMLFMKEEKKGNTWQTLKSHFYHIKKTIMGNE